MEPPARNRPYWIVTSPRSALRSTTMRWRRFRTPSTLIAPTRS